LETNRAVHGGTPHRLVLKKTKALWEKNQAEGHQLLRWAARLERLLPQPPAAAQEQAQAHQGAQHSTCAGAEAQPVQDRKAVQRPVPGPVATAWQQKKMNKEAAGVIDLT